MKNKKLPMLVAAALTAALAAGTALATASHVDIGGTRYTCPNGCFVLVRNGTYTVTDLKGAEVTESEIWEDAETATDE